MELTVFVKPRCCLIGLIVCFRTSCGLHLVPWGNAGARTSGHPLGRNYWNPSYMLDFPLVHDSECVVGRRE